MSDETRKDAPRAPRPTFETEPVEEPQVEKTLELGVGTAVDSEQAAEPEQAGEPEQARDAKAEVDSDQAAGVAPEVDPAPEAADAEPSATNGEPALDGETEAAPVDDPAPAASASDAPASDTKAAEAPAAPVPTGARGPIIWLRRTFPGNEHAVIGGVAGLICALLLFAIGVWRTLVIVVLIFVGVAIGQIADGDPKIIRTIKRLLPSRK